MFPHQIRFLLDDNILDDCRASTQSRLRSPKAWYTLCSLHPLPEDQITLSHAYPTGTGSNGQDLKEVEKNEVKA